MRSMEGDGLIYEMAVAMMDPTAVVPYLAASALMWTAMMVAMMVPAAIPMAAVFARLDRSSSARSAKTDPGFFVAGYLAVWIAFGLAATLVQWVLHRFEVLQGDLLALPAGPGAALLIITGMYELSPLKSACLTHCRSPMSFLLGHWRDGAAGAFEMGARHGLYCTGCCWML